MFEINIGRYFFKPSSDVIFEGIAFRLWVNEFFRDDISFMSGEKIDHIFAMLAYMNQIAR